MSYRFARVTNYYPQYLAYFYERNPVAGLTFNEHYHLLISDSVESASSFTSEFNKLQGVQATDLVSNARPLQDQWLKENNISASVSEPMLIIEQLAAFKPDVLWIDDFGLLDEKWIGQLKEKVPSVKLTVGHICAPYNELIESKFRFLDVIFSCIPCMVDELKFKGHNSFLLYHSFDRRLVDELQLINEDRPIPLLFSGSIYPGGGFHNTRLEYIERMLSEKLPLQLYVNLESRGKIFSKKLFYSLMSTARTLRLEKAAEAIPFVKAHRSWGKERINDYSTQLRAAAHPPVFGKELFRLLRNTAITFNLHGEIAGKCAGNIRMFEVTGAGSCLVTDWKENIHELFEPDKEIVTYRSADECIEKIRWLLDHPDECKKIAAAGQKRTLKDHTVEKRAIYLDKIFRERLSISV